MPVYTVSYHNTALNRHSETTLSADTEEQVRELFSQKYQAFCKITSISLQEKTFLYFYKQASGVIKASNETIARLKAAQFLGIRASNKLLKVHIA